MKKSYQSLEDNSDHTMKQVIYRNLSSRFLLLGLIALLSLSSNNILAQDGDPVKGKALFAANCAACHDIKLDKKKTGPALRNVEQRLADDEGLDRAWLSTWIRNSSGMIKDGDVYANKIFNEYNTAMTAYPLFTDQDISDVLAFTALPPPPRPEKITEDGGNGGGSGNGTNKIILWALALLFALLAAGLYLVNKTLRNFADEKGIALPETETRKPLWKAFVQNQFLVLVSAIFLLLASAYFAYGWMSQIGVDQGYQPIQEIHFSHKIHAGDNKIDCKYCHSSARVSKHSGIPALNICMNCHKSISEVAPETATAEYNKDFYDKEIQKLYKAAGWNDAEQKYTGITDAVRWTQIHNLPDFVYFNHSQHVTVAGVECQTCHGPVEEMEIVYQHAPLTMGWCINCHRETNVDLKDNAYYTKIHEELSKKYDVDELTAAQMGGLECGKCHY